MVYHILEIYTLSSMLLDINKEMEKKVNNRLKEIRDNIDWVIKHREKTSRTGENR